MNKKKKQREREKKPLEKWKEERGGLAKEEDLRLRRLSDLGLPFWVSVLDMRG